MWRKILSLAEVIAAAAVALSVLVRMLGPVGQRAFDAGPETMQLHGFASTLAADGGLDVLGQLDDRIASPDGPVTVVLLAAVLVAAAVHAMARMRGPAVGAHRVATPLGLLLAALLPWVPADAGWPGTLVALAAATLLVLPLVATRPRLGGRGPASPPRAPPAAAVTDETLDRAAMRPRRRAPRWPVGFIAGWVVMIAIMALATRIADSAGAGVIGPERAVLLGLLGAALIGTRVQLAIGATISFSLAMIGAMIGIAAATVGASITIATACVLAIAALTVVVVRVTT